MVIDREQRYLKALRLTVAQLRMIAADQEDDVLSKQSIWWTSQDILAAVQQILGGDAALVAAERAAEGEE